MNLTPTPANRHTKARDAALRQIARLGPFLEGSLCAFKRPGCAQPGWHLTFKQQGRTRTLYEPIELVAQCGLFGWKYILTIKEGRQPTTWEELIHLLPLHRANHHRLLLGPGGKTAQQDFRWVEDLMLGQHQTHVILQGEITPEAATLYAYATNFSNLSPQRVTTIVNCGGRERHLIEDAFNTQKNNGIGLEHVFCANANASKNYYTIMQVAQVLWILICRGCLRRLYDWARRATEQALARAVWEGLRACRLPPDLPPLGQIRFT
jgi:hypothetical protein